MNKDRLLILTHGLPGSGKSTWAQSKVEQNPDKIIRVNRDDIRTELFGEKYHRRNPDKTSENQVTRVHKERIKRGLAENKIVICDDTNLNPRFLQGLVQIAHNYGASVQSRYFDLPLDECKRRNAARDRVVPEHVIDRMWENASTHDGRNLKKFIFGSNGQIGYERDPSHPDEQRIDAYNASLPKLPRKDGEKRHAMIIDVDGTACDTRSISDKWMGNNQRNFHMFHTSSADALPNEDVLAIAKQARDNGISVLIVTARMANYSKVTIDWLKKHDFPVEKLYHRPVNDFRPDGEVKRDIYDQIVEDGYDVVHAVDDNPKVTQVWQKLGISITLVPWHTPVDLAEGQEPIKYEKQIIPSPIGNGACLRCGKPLKEGIIGPKCAQR